MNLLFKSDYYRLTGQNVTFLKFIKNVMFCKEIKMAIAARGAPPEPAIMAKAVMSIRMGAHRPTPVRAAAPTSGICPI